MKRFLKLASIPVILVIAFFVFPKIVALLINAHSDSALAGLVLLVSVIFGFIANKFFKKEN